MNELRIWFKQNMSKQRGRKIIGIERTFGFEISKEIKDSKQKKDGGSRTIDLDLLKK